MSLRIARNYSLSGLPLANPPPYFCKALQDATHASYRPCAIDFPVSLDYAVMRQGQTQHTAFQPRDISRRRDTYDSC